MTATASRPNPKPKSVAAAAPPPTRAAQWAAARPFISKLVPTAGAMVGGSRLTITGRHFGHVTDVLFGTTHATAIHSVSATTIRVTTPHHRAGTVDVRVVTTAGASRRPAADHFRYVPPPKITEVRPRASPLIGGVRVTVTGANFVRVKAVRFGTKAGRALTVLSAHKLQVTAPPHAAGVIGVRVVTAYGVSAARTVDHLSYAAAPGITKLSPASGFDIGGTGVAVTGSGFRSGTKVTFGGVPGTNVDLVSSRLLFVTTPRHADGPVTVRARTVFGTSKVTAKTSYSYVAVPAIGFTEVPPTLQFEAADVSCASATLCLAVGNGTGDGLWSVFNGASWSAPAPMHSLTFPFQVDCVSTTFCLALGTDDAAPGALATSRFTGSGWTAAVSVGSGWSDGQFDCTSPTFCMAVTGDFGSQPRAARFTGTSWVAAPAPGFAPAGLSCYAVHSCTAVGGLEKSASGTLTVRSSTYNGTSWAAPVASPLGGGVFAFTCVSAAFCLAVGLDSGSHPGWAVLAAGKWSARKPLPAGLVGPQDGFDPVQGSLYCLSETWCLLLSGVPTDTSHGLSAVFTGTSWDTPTAMPELGSFTDGGQLSCATMSVCVAALDDGALISYTGTWSTTAPFAGQTADVSCTAPTFCLAVDDYGHALTFDGATWTAVPPPADVGFLGSVSCTGPTSCVAIGSGLGPVAVTWDGSQWSAPVPLNGLAYASSVSCVAGQFCMVVGGTIASGAAGEDKAAAAIFDATSWTAASIIAGLDSPSVVSCASAGFCVVAGVVPDAQSQSAGFKTMSVYTAGTWTPSAVFSETDLFTIDCARGQQPFCLAASSDHTWTFTGSAWHAADPPPSSQMYDLSCPAANVCIGGSDNITPRAWLHTTSGWSDAIPIHTPNGDALFDVSCPTTSFCAFIPIIVGN